MTITIHPDSHTDHHIPDKTLHWVLAQVAKERAADLGTETIVHTVLLPPSFDPVPCALIGPATGFGKVPEVFVHYAFRGDRKHPSRMMSHPMAPTRKVTVVAGPWDGIPCVLFTAFGGPPAPKEPGDPRLLTDTERDESHAFWAVHALADGKGDGKKSLALWAAHALTEKGAGR